MCQTRWLAAIALSALAMVIAGCARLVPAVPVVQYEGGTLVVRDWLLIGPFWTGETEQPLDIPFLHTAGREALSAGKFNEIAAELDSDPDHEPRCGLVRDADVVDTYVALQVKRQRSQTGQKVVYAACTLRSPKSQTAYALLGSARGVRVFLNGAQVHRVESSPARRCRLYEDSFELPLRSGDNFLLVKVTSPGGMIAQVALRIEDSVEAAITAALQSSGSFLKNLVLPENAPVEIAVRGAPPAGKRWKVEICRGLNRNLVATVSLGDGEQWGPNPAALGPGLYNARIVFDGTVYNEVFCVGEPARHLATLKEEARPFQDREQVGINCGAIERRLEILCRPENRQPNNWDWQKKVVCELTAYRRIVSALQKGEEPFHGVTGLHLRGFRSRIDGSIQYYRVYAPSTYRTTDAAWPVVLVLPTPLEQNWQFIESPFLAWHNVAEELAKMAERQKVLLLWPGYRGRNILSPAELTHWDEAITAVGRDYTVDPARISLLGVCGAASKALAAVVEWPERFSAVGVLHGIFHTDERTEWVDDSLGKIQRKSTDPVGHWHELKGTPLWVLHDGAMPGHGELEKSLQFMAEARAAGWRPRFDQVPRSDPDSYGGIEMLMGWQAAQRREKPSARRSGGVFAGLGSYGPICRGLGDRFVLVEGTGGSEADRVAIRRLSAQFQAAWRTTYATQCSVTTDVALAEADAKDCNLVLLGNAETNAIWRKHTAMIPVSLHTDSVEIAGKKWTGSRLGIQAVFPDRENFSRRLVVIGSADLAVVRFGTMDLSLDGWFDFAVWSHGEVLTADYFKK